jgi:fumarate reductase flavoprotein subunit
MAWEAGAGKSDIMMEVTCKLPHSVQEYPNANNGLRQPNLVVNLDGERIMDEAMMENMTFCGNTVLRQRGKCFFNIMDTSMKKNYMKHGIHIINGNYPGFYIDGFDEEVDAAIANPDNDDIYKADTLEELAEMCGINVENLLETVDNYNDYCEQGYDEEFSKPRKYLKPLKKGPYYAGKFRAAGYGSLGGIKINHNLQVLDEEGFPIEGFYSMGTDCNNMYGDSYVYVFPGSTMCYALNSGRMAGENAAEYVEDL